MALRNFATKAGDDYEKDESYKKIVDNRNIPDIGKGSLYFRILSFEDADFSHGMEFWLNTGVVKNGKPVSIPFVSSLPFHEFVGRNDKTGAVYVSWKVGEKKCPLAKLAKENHPVIAKTSFGKGEAKPNVGAFHAARIQLIEPLRDAKGNTIKDDKGIPKFTIHAEERILKMRQGWWDQFVQLVEPEEVATQDDGFSESATKKPKAFPTKDLTKVVWMLTKERRTKNPSTDPAMNVDYVFDFSDRVVLENPPATPEPPIDFSKVFKAISTDELNKMKAKHEASPEGDEQDPASYGESLPEEAHSSGAPEDGF